ncbi:hypothetical protein [Enterobacteriaceae endosymbiont of Donacia provostii]|nr:hypothetical protein [Enterobacteriaceae endosymbiont of Donacia provostii]
MKYHKYFDIDNIKLIFRKFLINYNIIVKLVFVLGKIFVKKY